MPNWIVQRLQSSVTLTGIRDNYRSLKYLHLNLIRFEAHPLSSLQIYHSHFASRSVSGQLANKPGDCMGLEEYTAHLEKVLIH